MMKDHLKKDYCNTVMKISINGIIFMQNSISYFFLLCFKCFNLFLSCRKSSCSLLNSTTQTSDIDNDDDIDVLLRSVLRSAGGICDTYDWGTALCSSSHCSSSWTHPHRSRAQQNSCAITKQTKNTNSWLYCQR